jgi:hypothetical protein
MVVYEPGRWRQEGRKFNAWATEEGPVQKKKNRNY